MGTCKAALITVHGQGQTTVDYAQELEEELKKRLGSRWEEIAFETVYYQSVLQTNQENVWSRMPASVTRSSTWLREFLLYGFSDAAGLENQKERPGSAYEKAQLKIVAALLNARERLIDPTCPIFVIAQSLGGHIFSSYLWDAEHAPQHSGVWREGGPLQDEDKPFLKLPNLKTFFTTGCNIPVFVAGHDEIKPVEGNFAWHNYYDKDDPLGWPLQPLSESYRLRVRDHEIAVRGKSPADFAAGFTPFSHGLYWRDALVLEPLASALRDTLDT